MVGTSSSGSTDCSTRPALYPLTQDELNTQDIPVLLGRTLERFAFTDTSIPLDRVVPLLAASEQLREPKLSRTSVDCDFLKRFLHSRPLDGKSAITTFIVHGCQPLAVDTFARVQWYVTILESRHPACHRYGDETSVVAKIVCRTRPKILD